jgi:hypothetical protein
MPCPAAFLGPFAAVTRLVPALHLAEDLSAGALVLGAVALMR